MINLERLYLIRVPQNIFAIPKYSFGLACIYAGMLIAYWGSLNPWFMWPIGNFYIIFSSLLLCTSMAIGASMKDNTLFNNDNYLIPFLIHILLSYYLLFVNGGHIGGFIFNLFNISVFLSFFWVNKDLLPDILTFIAKAMAILLGVSIVAYVFYLVGFPLPSRDAEFNDGFYSYRNYFFFMIDQRTELELFPRFHSVFLEPGHLGSACVLLLLTQCGKWKKWYNVILLTATLMSFSLAAYVMLIVTVFLNLWIQGKHFIGKLIIAITIIATITIGSFFYRNGDNLLHNLIVMRLEIYDGEMVGNNRVTEDFDVEFENYLGSSDIFIGRDMPKDMFGNSGYKVFIYENGLIGFLLIFLLYLTSMRNTAYWKALTASVILALLAFIVRGYPLWYSNFLPLFAMAHIKKSCFNNTEENDSIL